MQYTEQAISQPATHLPMNPQTFFALVFVLSFQKM
jgi:hypothetical protein